MENKKKFERNKKGGRIEMLLCSSVVRGLLLVLLKHIIEQLAKKEENV